MTIDATTEAPAGKLLGVDRDLLPEERLMIEVLVCACSDLRLTARGAEADALRAAARDWIAADDEGWAMSFAAICRHFGVDPQAVRARLLGDRRHARLPQAA
jgi:hypothetical protein